MMIRTLIICTLITGFMAKQYLVELDNEAREKGGDKRSDVEVEQEGEGQEGDEGIEEEGVEEDQGGDQREEEWDEGADYKIEQNGHKP